MMVLEAGCSGAAPDGASVASESDLKASGKSTSLAAFESAMTGAQQWADNDPCSFSVTMTGQGLKLVLTADGKTATMTVTASETITLTDKAFGDGSIETYKIAGAGEVKVTNASDAFESIEVTPHGSTAATCEIDF
jgi:hypothetical protein